MPLDTESHDHSGRVPSNEPADPSARRGDAPPRVLVAEDEPHIARMLETLLVDAGLDVSVTGDGNSALDAIRSDDRLALAVVDLVMPGLGGLDVLEEARRLAPELPIIVLTAKGESEVRDRALDLGATDLFIKPFSPRQLVSRVVELCGTTRS